ncbi:Sugar kinase of the NBD/HSP70 family, may contain an N-terminal HTH domain [Paenibacillus uliginis N3/975]|uniref:Sugar kinase of the NBD/HSP70 family, may contain an N-terminal HTH domain n=1 Tax=Paenibacillus uliginis N3/975 TaxID=1313296 RepID=A0A1X7HDH8_9BACL|nr:ROK family transcriptional regulator [Paenibacillus uliginis]SMF84234.1 Sugar kinase of the NBD/HSP70 family, may contain an N-terminal HTH domain [Paenibacillus uliginis N3/975]
MKSIGGNAIVMKEVNINLVRKALKAEGEATKQQIAKATGLSAVTVGTILQQLLQTTEVKEAALCASGGGRPAQRFKYNGDYAYALTLFPYEAAGRIIIRSTIVNLIGNMIYERMDEVEYVDLACFEHIIDSLMASYPAIRAIGFGLPGAEWEGRIIISDYKALVGVSIVDYFRELYGMPVIMENDVNAAVVGYCERKHIRSDADVVYLYFPDRFPPGAGILINGQLFKGRRNFAGEIAKIPLGIPWGEATFMASSVRVEQAIVQLIVSICAVLNPDCVVLYGSFIEQANGRRIAELCSKELPVSAMPEVIVSEDFSADYLEGMIAQTLATLEPSIVLSRYE